MFLAGRDFLLREEVYYVSGATIAKNLSVDIANYFLTPYDPRTEVRLGDFGAYKNHLLSLRNEGRYMEAEEFIRQNKHQYATQRYGKYSLEKHQSDSIY